MSVFRYLKIQLKRAFKLFPAIFIITTVTLLSIAMVASMVVGKNQNSQEKKMAKIGVVGSLNDSYLGIGIKSIQMLDESKDYLELVEMSQEQAVKELKEKKITAFVELPDSFINDIAYGRNTPARFVYMDGPRGMGSIMLEELTEQVSDFVTETQTAVYTLRAVVRETGDISKIDEQTTDLNLKYVDFLLNRDEIYAVTYTGIADNISAIMYYICGFIIFFLLIWGISCNRLLGNKNIEVSKIIYCRNIKSAQQILCEYFSFFVITLIFLVFVAILAGLVFTFVDTGIDELSNVSIFSCLLFAVKTLPVVMMITMMHFMTYEIFSGTVGSLLIQFIIAIGLSYISGCFYPISFFPEGMQNFAGILPSGIGFSFLRKTVAEGEVFYEYLACILYFFLFYAITVAVRKTRIAGDDE